MEEDPKATQAAQLRHFDLGTWKAIELIAGHRTSSETMGVIAFDGLFASYGRSSCLASAHQSLDAAFSTWTCMTG